MAVLGINDFKSALSGGGARPNLYKVTVTAPLTLGVIEGIGGADAANFSFMCRAAQLPASIMGVAPVPFRGRVLQVAGDRVFEPWIVTVYNDTNFKIRSGCEAWMNAINAHEDNVGVTNPADYQSDLIVEQLDKSGKQIYRYDFRGTFPTNISDSPLAYDANDVIEEFTIEFQVQYWESFKGTLGPAGGRGTQVAGAEGAGLLQGP